MKQNNFKDEIAEAERKILIVSWIGIISAIAVIALSLLTFS